MLHALLLLAIAQAAQAQPEVDLTDLRRFPPATVSRPLWEQACDCVHNATARLGQFESFRPPGQCAFWAALLDDAQWCLACWTALDDAWIEHRSHEQRLQDLQTLRDLIGDYAYYAGWMPPPVPVWRYCPVGD